MNFKTAVILACVALLICIGLHIWWEYSVWLCLLPILGLKAAVIYGVSNIDSGFFIQAHCAGSGSEKEIAISFDDGPHPTYTKAILETLAAYQAKATFFVIGKNIAGNELLLAEMDNQGHTIGNHSFSHSFFIDFKTRRGFVDEILKTEMAIFKVIGKRSQLFRPPYGVTTPGLAKACKQLKYQVVGWSIRSFDTSIQDAWQIAQRVQKAIRPGAVILMHDCSERSHEALKQILEYSHENGYRIVSLPKLLQIEAYQA